MMEPDELQDDPVQAALRKARAAKPQSADPVADILAKIRGPADPNVARPNGKPRGFRTPEQIVRENAADKGNARDEMAQDEATTRGKVLGAFAAPLAEVPGGAVVQRILSGDATKDAIASAPAYARIPAKVLGAAASNAMLPGSTAMKGAQYAAGMALTDDDPNKGAGDRIKDAAIAAPLGWLGGKTADVVTTGLRGLASKSLGQQALARRTAMQGADRANYGLAVLQGRNATPNEQLPIKVLLDSPKIKPFADAVRSTEEFHDADLPTVAREAIKLMSERQGTLGQRIVNANDFKAGTSLDAADIGALKKQLVEASTPSMPALPGAMAEHAKQAGERDAMREGADVARRVVRQSSVAGKKLETKSPEAFRQALAGYTPEQGAAAAEGITGRLRESFKPSANPFTLFGAGPYAAAAARTTGLLNAADAASGRQPMGAFERALAAMLSGGMR